MLKKLIASILIPAFLIQIIGCYSNSEIAINELEMHKKDAIKLVTKDSKEYSLLYDSINKNRNWELADSVIYVKSKKLEPNFAGNIMEKVDTAIIPLSSVKGFYIHSFDAGMTIWAMSLVIVYLVDVIVGFHN